MASLEALQIEIDEKIRAALIELSDRVVFLEALRELLVEPNRAWHDIERDPYRAGACAPTLRELVDRQAGKIP